MDDVATQIVTINLRPGERWCWLPDIRVLALDAKLTDQERIAAVDDFVSHARQELQRLNSDVA